MQEDRIAQIVEAVLKELQPVFNGIGDADGQKPAYADGSSKTQPEDGIFADMEEALDAAAKARKQLIAMGMGIGGSLSIK